MQAAKMAVHAKVTTLCQDIRTNPFTLRIIMQPFTPEQTHAFLDAALEGVQVSAEVARNLWEKTGGLPLYIEQARPRSMHRMLCLESSVITSAHCFTISDSPWLKCYSGVSAGESRACSHTI